MTGLNHDDTTIPPVPKEFGGKWIAWNKEANKIIASGDTLVECEKNAKKSGEPEPRFEKVPSPDVRIIGAAH